MSKTRALPLVVLTAVAALPLAFAFACGGSDKKVVDVNASFGGDGGTTSSGACAPGQPCPPAPSCAPGQLCPPAPSASTAPMGSVYTTDPNAVAQLLAAAAAAGSALLAPMGGGDPVELGIRTAANQYAPGMKPEGQMAKGNLQEGGHVGFIVNMDAAHCYTIIGFGVGVTDLDLNLLAPPVYTILSAQDGTVGPTAIIGAAPKPMCPVIPIAVPYKVDIYAKKGGGLVGAQVYSKPK